MAYSVTKCDVGGSTANGYHYEYLCESADDIADLPTGASSTEISRPAPGSLAYIESDSSARYILKISREWGEYPMAGGGGSTGGGVFVVSITSITGGETADKTMGEIVSAMQAGKPVMFVDKTDAVLDPDNPVSETTLCSIPATGVYFEEYEGVPIWYLLFPRFDSAPTWAQNSALFSYGVDALTMPPTTIQPDNS